MKHEVCVLALTAAAMGACSSNGLLEVPTVPRETHAVVRVTVEQAEGEPVPGASVNIAVIREGDAADEVVIGECAGELVVEGDFTAEGGSLEERLVTAEVSEFVGCLAISVEPPHDSGLAPGAATGTEVRFRAATSEPDTASVTVTLEQV